MKTLEELHSNIERLLGNKDLFGIKNFEIEYGLKYS